MRKPLFPKNRQSLVETQVAPEVSFPSLPVKSRALYFCQNCCESYFRLAKRFSSLYKREFRDISFLFLNLAFPISKIEWLDQQVICDFLGRLDLSEWVSYSTDCLLFVRQRATDVSGCSLFSESSQLEAHTAKQRAGGSPTPGGSMGRVAIQGRWFLRHRW